MSLLNLGMYFLLSFSFSPITIIIVIGEKEKESKKYTPRFRSDKIGESKSYTIEELHDLVSAKTKAYPQKPIALSKYLSVRPKFK